MHSWAFFNDSANKKDMRLVRRTGQEAMRIERKKIDRCVDMYIRLHIHRIDIN